jgi:hypothetical protein
MRSKPFQKELGGTTECAVRMAQDTCQIFISGDLWFSYVNSMVNIKKCCVHQKESVFSVKTAHSFFPKSIIEEVLMEEPGGASIVLKSELDGVILIAIGYEYNKKHVLYFVMS